MMRNDSLADQEKDIEWLISPTDTSAPEHWTIEEDTS